MTAPTEQPATRQSVLSLSWVALCVALSGVLTYGFLALVARAMPAAEYADFGAFWSMTLILGFGAFLPVELELARSLSSRGAGGLPRGTVRTTSVLVVACLGGTLLTAPLLLTAFQGQLGPLVALLALVVTSAGQFVLRGTLLGRGQLRSHGTLLLVDSALRVGFAAVVAVVLPGAGPTAYAWALVAAISAAHLPVLVWLRVWRPSARGRDTVPLGEPAAAERGFGSAVTHLLVGTVSGQVLLNSMPIVVAALAVEGETRTAAAFVACFTLVRLPLFVAVPVQSALVPLFVAARRAGGPSAARRLVVRLLLATAGAAVAGLALGAVVGRPLVSVLFGPEYVLSATDLGLMSAGAGVHLGLLVVSQVLVASERHRAVAVVWASGLALGGLVFAVVPDLVLRATLAFAVGSAAALLVSAWFVLRPPAEPVRPVAETA